MLWGSTVKSIACGRTRSGTVNPCKLGITPRRFLLSALLLSGMAVGSPVFSAALDGEKSPEEPAVWVAQASKEVDFAVPSLSLSEALDRLSQQTGLSFAYRPADIAGLSSNRVSGRYAIAEGLRRLLHGTGIDFTFTGPSTIVLELGSEPADNSLLRLDTVFVEGKSETAYGPVDGYRALRSSTATKTDTPIEDVPVSVQVVPRDTIEDQAALHLDDLYSNVSGVQQAGNTLNAQSEVLPIIRGYESPVLLRNGLRATNVGTVDLFNIERVEVLKGPASILFGALDPGGQVNTVTKRPGSEESYEAAVQYGSFNFKRATFDATGGVSEDGRLAYRFNAALTDSDSFRDEMFLKRQALAPSLLWTPQTGTELLAEFTYVGEEQPYDSGVPLGLDGQPLVTQDTFFGDPGLRGRNIDDYALNLQFRHQVNDFFELRSQAQIHRAEAKNESLRNLAFVGDRLVLRYQNEDRTDDEAQLVIDGISTFEVDGSTHELLTGLEYVFQDSEFNRFRTNIALVDVNNDPNVNIVVPVNQPKQEVLGRTAWWAAYAQNQMTFLDDGALKVLIGGRYDKLKQSSDTNRIPAPGIDENNFSGRIGTLYEFSDRHAAYISVSQSFVPQQNGVLDVDNVPLPSETGLQYEIGFKSQFLDDTLSLTGALFQIDRENVAVFDQATSAALGRNVFLPGVSQRSQGIEFDLTGELADGLRIIANYSFTRTEVTENQADPTAEGNRVGGVPNHLARVWLNYAFPSASALHGLGIGGGVRYVGRSDAQFNQSIRLDPFAVFDAALSYSYKDAKFSLNLNNILDKEYIARASSREIAHFGEPFSVVGSLRLKL